MEEMEENLIVPETVLCRVCLAEEPYQAAGQLTQPQDQENKFLSLFDKFGNHTIADLINEQLVEQIIVSILKNII
jgi:hypothetical protein